MAGNSIKENERRVELLIRAASAAMTCECTHKIVERYWELTQCEIIIAKIHEDARNRDEQRRATYLLAQIRECARECQDAVLASRAPLYTHAS